MSETQNTTREMKTNLGKTTALVVSFDTTGSMQPCIAQVRQKLRDLVEMMTQDIPGLKIGLIAHGDYCDGPNAVNVLDLTDNLEKIMKFITDAPNTTGGDSPECYELALNRARGMSWPKEGGSLILIGDDEPHPPEYPGNTDKLNWREEVKALKGMNVNVFPLQCMQHIGRPHVNLFWEQVSGESATPLLILENFGDSANVLEACAYASAGAPAFEGYMTKGLVGGSASVSSNMAENRSKLRSWTTPTTPKGETPKDETPK